MRTLQFIFLGAIIVAIVIACIKAKGKVKGGIIGGLLGLMLPLFLAQIFVWRGGDPTAAGAYSFIAAFTIPFGIFAGVMVGKDMSKDKAPTDKSEFRCLKCDKTIRPEDTSCPNCGWSWK